MLQVSQENMAVQVLKTLLAQSNSTAVVGARKDRKYFHNSPRRRTLRLKLAFSSDDTMLPP